jgi:hypothetical protein
LACFGDLQPLDIFGRDHVHDGRADDLVTGIAEHVAGGVVDVDVTAFEVRNKDTVGGLLKKCAGTCPRPFERVMRLVETNGSDGKKEKACQAGYDGKNSEHERYIRSDVGDAG